MENSYSIEKIDNLKNVVASVRALRYDKELEYYNAEISKRAPKMIGNKENFFQSLGKKITNSINDYGYNEFQEKKSKVEFLIGQLKNDFTIYSGDELRENLNNLFLNDNTGVAKMEFSMNIILDNSYKFEVNDYSYRFLSNLMDEEDDYLFNLEKKMKEAYSQIAINRSNIKRDALIVGSLLSLVVIGGGVGGILGACAGSAAGLTTLGISVAEGVSIVLLGSALTTGATIALSYGCLKEAEKYQIKKQFQELTIDEATLALVKTVLPIIHLKENLNDDNKALYDQYIEEYLDLKSDVDLNLFMNDYKVDDNKKKNKLFSNADELLKKKLFS